MIDDLAAETDSLLAVLDDRWDLATPAPGWTVTDQLTHLAFFDEALVQAITDPDEFAEGAEEAGADIDAYVHRITRSHRHLTGPQARDWLVHARAQLLDTVRPLDLALRVPWYGPDMSLMSALTARLMETWAHGQDIVDALGAHRPPTDRLRHVAFLGWRALPNSYLARGRPVPEVPVRVELDEGWVFGPDDATDVVRGPAEDFCLLVTQRRHLGDTGLMATGPVATEWLTIAQAFAGPPGAGRQPGQFA